MEREHGVDLSDHIRGPAADTPKVSDHEIAAILRERFIHDKPDHLNSKGVCRACDGTGSVPGNNMGDASHSCHFCGRGRNIESILRELEK